MSSAVLASGIIGIVLLLIIILLAAVNLFNNWGLFNRNNTQTIATATTVNVLANLTVIFLAIITIVLIIVMMYAASAAQKKTKKIILAEQTKTPQVGQPVMQYPGVPNLGAPQTGAPVVNFNSIPGGSSVPTNAFSSVPVVTAV
jgi:hypothetical protein